MCCVCKSCVVCALLPAQCAGSVSPVLCLLSVLPVQFAVRGLRQVFLLLIFILLFFALMPVQCTVHVSPMLCCTTASAVCCVRKPCVVFTLLPVQCAVCVSPVLCLLNVYYLILLFFIIFTHSH